MKIQLDSLSDDVRIEILPLMDVIFCILTFFILGAVGLTRQQAINLDLPKASTGEAQMREMLIVSVDHFGQTYVEQQPVTRQQLSRILRSYNQQKPQGLMVLYASKMASYNDVVQVLDLLRDVGGNRVALATLPGSGEGGNTPNSFENFNPSDPNVSPYPDVPSVNPGQLSPPGLPQDGGSVPSSPSGDAGNSP
jgi:biopolymer transport protein ExbD